MSVSVCVYQISQKQFGEKRLLFSFGLSKFQNFLKKGQPSGQIPGETDPYKDPYIFLFFFGPWGSFTWPQRYRPKIIKAPKQAPNQFQTLQKSYSYCTSQRNATEFRSRHLKGDNLWILAGMIISTSFILRSTIIMKKYSAGNGNLSTLFNFGGKS